MANVPLKSGNNYNLARIQNKTVIIGSDDHSHATRIIDQQLKISGSNVPGVALQVNMDGNGRCNFLRTGAESFPMFQLKNTTDNGHCSMMFQGDNTYTMGTRNNTTAGTKDFQLRDSSNLSSSPRTNSSTCFVFAEKDNTNPSNPIISFFLPNIDTAAGSHFLKWNSSTREVTYASSTQKIKKNITSPPSKIYDNILALQPRYFEMKNPKDSGKQFLSFIAEETADVLPQFATYGPDWAYDDTGFQKEEEMLSDKQVPIDIDDRAIIAALVGKVQDLELRLKQLENK